MWRPFMRAPAQILAVSSSEIRPNLKGRILDLPEPVLDAIFDRLGILDRCCLALCCKALFKRAADNEHLEYGVIDPPSSEQLRIFFEERLGGEWLRGRLKYCTDCGRFVSTSGRHWRNISEIYTRERSGRIPGLWKSRREDGWLRYWIERWSETDIEEPHAGSLLLRREDPTTVVCPRCAVQNVECNAWRLNRTRQARCD